MATGIFIVFALLAIGSALVVVTATPCIRR
jgi:NADH:ubiquinone oxidoreductase subunit 6 (subunit J)